MSKLEELECFYLNELTEEQLSYLLLDLDLRGEIHHE